MNNILITGLPGVGKTTLFIKLSEALEDSSPIGFYTAEIRERGERLGFELIDFDGRRELLSHVEIRDAHRVGKYGVNLKGFEDFLDSIPFLAPASRLVMIDEIGKMECFSSKFINLVRKILDSDRQFIATIALKGSGFIAELKKRSDIRLFEMTQRNRESLLTDILGEAKLNND